MSVPQLCTAEHDLGLAEGMPPQARKWSRLGTPSSGRVSICAPVTTSLPSGVCANARKPVWPKRSSPA